jgi:DeoR family transcriptional regulator, fructose operon transcriptional repressor
MQSKGKLMLSYERQTRIVQLIQQRMSVPVNELSQYFDVSPMTIRRDLSVLEEKGLVVRVHGGVTVPNTTVALREQEREAISIAQKVAIGEYASGMIENHHTIFLDAGTTTAELARRLVNRQGLTVVTNSVKVLSILADAPGVNLIGVGGFVYGGAWSFVGSLAEAAIRRFHSDLAFLGISSLSLTGGLTEVNYFEGDTKNLIIKQSQRVVLLADSSKFEKISPISVAPLSEIDVIITDDHLSPDLAEAYRRAGPQVILAPTNVKGQIQLITSNP